MRTITSGVGGEGNRPGSEGEAVNTGSQQQQLVSGVRESRTSGKPDTMGGLDFVQGKESTTPVNLRQGKKREARREKG